MIENKISFEDIQKANETIKPTDIKGREYAEVNQRIKAFRMVYPDGVIKTELKSNDNGICIFEAKVYKYYRTEAVGSLFQNSVCSELLATGTAYEKEGSSYINKTSYIENCETSAVGRALGMCGFGIDTSIASAEEVENAQLQQEAVKIIDKIKVNALKQAIEKAGLTNEQVNNVLSNYSYTKIEDIKLKDYGNICNKLRTIKEFK